MGGGMDAWDDWLDSAPGRYLLAWEQAQLDAAVADVFGFHALQCGLRQLDALRANRMPNRMAARLGDEPDAVRPPPAAPVRIGPDPAADASAPQPQPQPPPPPAAAEPAVLAAIAPAGRLAAAAAGPVAQPVLIDSFGELPFASVSLDLVVLPHVLERAADPYQVLREVDRVLRPEGRLIVTGFNPVSLWGARQAMLRGVVRPFLPPDARPIGLPRLRDWLRLLSFEPDRGRFGCYVPPCRTQRWLQRLQWVEKAGDRWWPICGALYLLSSVKRVRGMRLIGPAWKPVPVKAAAVAGRAPVRRDPAPLDPVRSDPVRPDPVRPDPARR